MSRYQDKLAEREFFDQISQDDDYDVFDRPTKRHFLRMFAEAVGTGAANVVIDLGCGTGAFTSTLAGRAASVVGVDISFGSLQHAVRCRSAGATFICADIEELPFRRCSADVVVFSGVLHHFPELRRCAAEAYHILKPGGVIFSFDPHRYHPGMWAYRDPASPISTTAGRTRNERLLTRRELLEVFGEAGFAVSVKAVSPVTYRHVAKGKWLLPVYNTVERLFGLSPLASWFGAFLVMVARKL